MTRPQLTRPRCFALALLCLAAAAPTVRAQEEAPAPEAHEEALAAEPARSAEIVRIAAILRLSRREDSPGRVDLVRGLVQQNAETIEALLDLLTAGRVPKVHAGHRRQLLSEPQTELVLGALSELDAGRVRAACERRLSGRSSVAEHRALVLALGASGDAGVLERMLRRWRPRDGGEFPELGHREWAQALQLLLARDRTAHAVAAARWREARPEIARGLIEACGELRDPAALPLVASMLEQDGGDLATLAMGQVARIGRGFEPGIDERVCEALRSRCDPTFPNQCQMALQALGELRDRATLERSIGWLDGDEHGIRQSALWALRRATGVELEPKAETWRRWFAEQEKTLESAPRRITPKLDARDLATVVQGLRELAVLRIERPLVATWIEPVLKRREPGLRAQACEALGDLDERTLVPALREMLADPDHRVVAAARTALVKLTGRDEAPEEQAASAGTTAAMSNG
ncbi:MAG: HEAT repeat domain-containing protein [Planctomycetes bacterium]|nr:HEAT repeat domain-containing protein [Planctomycetota bacterium]